MQLQKQRFGFGGRRQAISFSCGIVQAMDDGHKAEILCTETMA